MDREVTQATFKLGKEYVEMKARLAEELQLALKEQALL